MESIWKPRGENISQAWIDRQMHKIDVSLAAMSKNLGNAEWCHDNHFGLADIALGCALGYLLFRYPQISWQAQYPNLAKHYEKLSKRPSFANTLPPA